MSLNIYQAALTLRLEYGHLDGIEVEACTDAYTNLYFIHHDALHTLLGAAPEEEQEPIVLAAEMLLGGVDIFLDVDLDELTTRLASIERETMELFMEFYSGWFNQ